MIETISLTGVPAFSPGEVQIGPLARINIVYGPNGSGKTSIGRVIAAHALESEPRVFWTGPALAVKVFNRDYVERTFGLEDEIGGVFVLGAESKEAQHERQSLELERETLGRELAAIRTDLNRRREDQVKLDSDLQEQIWRAKETFTPQLDFIFEGYRASKQKLKERVLDLRGNGKPTIPDRVALAAKAPSVFDDSAVAVVELAEPALLNFDVLRISELWGQSIIGSKDVTLAELIAKLNNSDWVQQGARFLDQSEGACPFCQQQTPIDLAQSLVDYFDGSYRSSVADLQELADAIEADLGQIEVLLEGVPDDAASFIDRKSLDAASANLAKAFEEVRSVVGKKLGAPSIAIEMPDVESQLADVIAVITNANSQIKSHNELIADRAAAKEILISSSWDAFVWDELEASLAAYGASRGRLDKDIGLMTEQARSRDSRQVEISERLKVLADGITSSDRAISEINRMLDAAGFTSFKLDRAVELKDGYRLIREDGNHVADTWSEGEKSFVTFLYFLHEVRGFDLDKGAQPDCVVVIDDPVSSMDSDSLFFISTNVRAMIREVKEGSGNIRQLMVLTHNVYFHKEVAHHLAGKPITLKKEDLAFHVIKKSRPGPNRIVSSGKDSITSTYELLWADVRDAQTTGKSGVGLQNTMRRIVESYFNFTGNLKPHEVPDEVEGQERLIWRSLISWLHDGSHKSELFDEIHFSPDASDLSKHLKVFKQIFDQTGNADHFSKMMRES